MNNSSISIAELIRMRNNESISVSCIVSDSDFEPNDDDDDDKQRRCYVIVQENSKENSVLQTDDGQGNDIDDDNNGTAEEICDNDERGDEENMEDGDEEEVAGDEEGLPENEVAAVNRRTQWLIECEFSDRNGLDEFLKEEWWWSLRGSSDTIQGRKILYRCNRFKRLGEQCAAGVYVIVKETYASSAAASVATENVGGEGGVVATTSAGLHSNDAECKTTYVLYRKTSPHTHDEVTSNKSNKVTAAVHQLIIEKHKMGKKAKTISFEILDNAAIAKKDKPSYKQIRSVIKTYQNSEYGEQPISMNELTKFVQKYSDVPDDVSGEDADDVAFIIDFERSPSSQQNNKFFTLFISTPRLLRMASEAHIIHADATHKVATEKLPLLVLGVTDNNKMLHFAGMTLTTNEKIVDYEFTFNSFCTGVRYVTGTEFTGKPLSLVTDADPAIHRGFERCFGEWAAQIIMCYFHVMLNVQSKYKFHGQLNKAAFKEDLAVLHKDVEPEATRLIAGSFFKNNKNWYIGCSPRIPKHNNGLESFNSTMKRFQTEHQRQPLKVFLHTALRIVRQRSTEYLLDKKAFDNVLHISDNVYKKGFELAGSSTFGYVHGDEQPNGDYPFFIYRSGLNKKITLKDVEAFKKRKYKNFEDFAKHSFDIWNLRLPPNSSDWEKATCSCPAFDQENMCKHIVAIAVDLKVLEEPPAPPLANYDDEPLFFTKRGRPKKATGGLTCDEQ